MRLLASCMIVTFWIAINPAFAGSAFAERAGGLSFKHTTWDFGKIDSVKKQTHRFTYENRSGENVIITSVTPSCGCTAATAPGQTRLEPGEKGFIDVTFNPVGKKGDFSSTVSVETNAGKPDTLTIKAHVMASNGKPVVVRPPSPEIDVSPLAINFGALEKGDTAIYKIVIGNKGAGDLYIRNFLATNRESGRPLNQKPIKKNKKIELTAFYKAEEKGKISDFLVIISNDPKRPKIRIKLTGTVN